MPVTPTTPGVYIEEISSGVRTIVGVSTSVTGVLGYFRRGPLDTPIQVFNMGGVEREFGGIHPLDEAGYALQQFFLNGGSNAWVVRVASGDSTELRASSMTVATDSGNDIAASAGRQFRGRSVADPGTWGDNLRVIVDYETRDPADATLFNLTVSEVDRVDGRRVILRSETYSNLSTDSTSSNYAIAKVNEASKLIQLSEPGGTAGRPDENATVGSAVDPAALFGPTSTLNVSTGGPARAVTLTDLAAGTTFAAAPRDIRRALERAIRVAGTTNNEPALAGATVSIRGGALVVRAGGGASADFDPSVILTFTENGQTTSDDLGLLVAGGATANVQEYALGGTVAGSQTGATGGLDGLLPDQDALIGDFDDKLGIYALRDVDLFNILIIPGAVASHLSDDQTAAVYAAAEAFCRDERAFLIVDLPERINEVQEVQRLDRRPQHPGSERGDLLPTDPDPRPAQRRPPAQRRHQRHDGRGLRPHRRRARRLEGAGRARRRAPQRAGLRRRPDRPRERAAQPGRHQRPAPLPDLRPDRLGRAHPRRGRRRRRRSGSTSRSAGSPCSSRRACTAGCSGWCSNPTTSRCGRRSG